MGRESCAERRWISRWGIPLGALAISIAAALLLCCVPIRTPPSDARGWIPSSATFSTTGAEFDRHRLSHRTNVAAAQSPRREPVRAERPAMRLPADPAATTLPGPHPPVAQQAIVPPIDNPVMPRQGATPNPTDLLYSLPLPPAPPPPGQPPDRTDYGQRLRHAQFLIRAGLSPLAKDVLHQIVAEAPDSLAAREARQTLDSLPAGLR